ncbi:hypothetical protein Celaphus_00013610, partial [Cervus elaphus hippelaphus]
MDSDTLQVFQSELTCSICMNCFLDPVTIDCGHSFCRPCLSLCWEEGQTPRSCPESLNLMGILQDKLVKRMRSLWKLREEMQISLNQEANKTQSFENYVALRKVMITVLYQRIPLLLHEDEKLHLEALEREGKEICQQLKESVLRMTQQGESLKEVYRELTAMCHKPDTELLQSLGRVPSCRTESAQLLLPQPVVPELSVWPIPGLIDWLRRFQAYTVLYNERVTHHLPVFEDLRCLLAGPDGPGIDYTPPRSKYFLAWGAESFTSGQHYWEVDVAGCCNWAIGLCNDSWARESDMALDSKGIFLLLCIKKNSQYNLFTSFPLLPQYVKKPLGQVGMFLDYDGGILSFF